MRTTSFLVVSLRSLLLAAPAAAEDPSADAAPVLVASAPLAPITGDAVGVAAAQHRDAPIMHRRSTGLMIAGIALATAGAGAVAAGTALAVHGSAQDAECEETQARVAASGAPLLGSCLTGTLPVVGYAVIAGGASLVAVGIPMAIVGAWQVPADEAPRASALPAVHVGVGSAKLDWTF